MQGCFTFTECPLVITLNTAHTINNLRHANFVITFPFVLTL